MSGEALARYSTEQLAGHLWQRRTVDGGVAFARTEHRPNKDAARNEVLRDFSRRGFFPGKLSIFTMPGLHWKFERELLLRRDARALYRRRSPERTFICGIEREEAIFRASLKDMPGAIGYGTSHIAVCNAISCATAAVRTRLVGRYYRCTFEDYAATETSEHQFDGAWLDFNGQLTDRRLDAIVQFWNQKIRTLLVVTGLNARTQHDMSARIREAGSIASLLHESLPESRLVRSITYNDTVPMFQVTLVRPNQ